ncbi:MAG: glutamate synthase subunit beta [Bacteroidota bacterium]
MTKDHLDFIERPRRGPQRRDVAARVRDDRDVYIPLAEQQVTQQARRCMGCGVPFCQSGCPLGNAIPDWNDAVMDSRWREAYERLAATNNFPEFTGRICPAPCESACVLGLIEDPVTIEHIEQAIAEHAFQSGWVQPATPTQETGKHVAIVGSGPAGLAAAEQLRRVGHGVTVFERDEQPGGLLRYGIPDFKLEKHVVERRVALLEAAGIQFQCGVEVGCDVTFADLRAQHDAVLLATGATRPRPLGVPGDDLGGVHYAWEYLWQDTRRVAGIERPTIDAKGKHVIVIGGGDTASDCIGVANRQGAASITNFHIWPAPPTERPADQPWPFIAHTLEVSSSHEEGCERVWAIATHALHGDERVNRLTTLDVEVIEQEGRRSRRTVPGTEREWRADLVLVAIGYAGPEIEPLMEQLPVELDQRGRIATDDRFATDHPGVFAAGDNRRGASLVVWAISEGREAARAIDAYLMGASTLPTKGEGDLVG